MWPSAVGQRPHLDFGASQFKRLRVQRWAPSRPLDSQGIDVRNCFSSPPPAADETLQAAASRTGGDFFFAQSRNLANVMFYSKTLNKRSCVSNSVWVGKVREKKTKTREGAANGVKCK